MISLTYIGSINLCVLCVFVVRSTHSPAGLYPRIHFTHQTWESRNYIFSIVILRSERVKNSSIKEISREEGLGWEEVELIFNHFSKELEKEDWEYPERISLDEFSNLKGHKDFITTVVALNKKILLDVIKGHKQEELKVLEKVKEVIVDMWSGFTAVIKELFPKAKIVYDRFHGMDIIHGELNE
ncbi:transposase [Microcystis aeruginosa NIES-3804]|uniref:Transposase n=1 Tax=Microcystis aeruginosa NIES-3804 TaxID=2517783 RepID=A0A6H9GLT0_MICAE|nr:transposase [Microcystis aeruginosa NIES-3804]